MISTLMLLAAAPATLAQAPLQPFAPLVGHCWVGPVPGAGSDKHCFESVYGGQHVRDRHAVTAGGREVYAGETIYSAKGAQVIFTYWNSLGGVGTGTASFSRDEWHFVGSIHGSPSAGEQPINLSWKLLPDGYEVEDVTGSRRLFKRAD